MFGLLKNKLASFIKGLSGKEEQKIAEAQPEGPSPNAAAVGEEKKIAEIKTEPQIEKKETPKPEKKEELKHKHVEEKPVETKHGEKLT